MIPLNAGRYGASLTAFILGGYLLLSAQIVLLGQGFVMGPEIRIDIVVSVLVAFIVAVAAVMLHPAPLGRRLIAAVVVVVGLVINAVLLMARMFGGVRISPEFAFVYQVLSQWQVAVLFFLLLAWLIVRNRSALSYLLLLLTPLVGLVSMNMVMAGIDSAFISVSTQVLALVLSVGIAWLAASLSRGRTPSYLLVPQTPVQPPAQAYPGQAPGYPPAAGAAYPPAAGPAYPPAAPGYRPAPSFGNSAPPTPPADTA